MRTHGILFAICLLLMSGCTVEPPAVDGNPFAGKGVLNLTTAKLGQAGGFIDANSDGYADIIVGAPEASIARKKTGAALVYYGKQNGYTATPDVELTGQANGDMFGFSFVNLQDINGDGKADYAIGAINAAGEAELSGVVYVYAGGQPPVNPILTLKGRNAFDKFGYAISSGDVNHDGAADIIVSAPYTFHEEFQSGGIYIYFGGEQLDDKPDAIISGRKANASIGMAMATGDVNGDNVDDLIVDGHAKVYIYYGRSNMAERLTSSQTPDVMVRSDSSRHGGSGFGYAIEYLGDITDDGIGDFAVGNRRRSSPSVYDNRGSLYVFKGSATYPAEFYEDNLDYRVVKVLGEQTYDNFASSITNIGDVNQGGKTDLLVGARWADHDTANSKLVTGAAYILHGEDLQVLNPGEDQPITIAAARFSHDESSAEYGKFVAISGERILVGIPSANKHDGGIDITNIQYAQ